MNQHSQKFEDESKQQKKTGNRWVDQPNGINTYRNTDGPKISNSGSRSPKKYGRTSPGRSSKRRYSPDRNKVHGSSSSKRDNNSFFKNPEAPAQVSKSGNWNRGGGVVYNSKPRSYPPPSNRVDRVDRVDRYRGRTHDRERKSGREFDRNKGRGNFKTKQLNREGNFKARRGGKGGGMFKRSRSWGDEINFKEVYSADKPAPPGAVRGRHNSDPNDLHRRKRPMKNYNKSNQAQSSNPNEIHPKQRFKNFSNEIKMKKDFTEAEEYVNQVLEKKNYLPPHQRWKAYLMIAELARREGRFQEARKWFRSAGKEFPNEAQIWLEFARMEEECGLMGKSEEVLLEGLVGCPYSENLYIKLIRQYEQLNQIDKSRKLLGKVRQTLGDSLLRVWRVILEGAMMESRMGRIEEARIAFQYLMENCPVNGSIYMEALRLEQKREDDDTSLRIIRLGLRKVRSHAPLWIQAMKLYQKRNEMDEMRRTVQESVGFVTKEIRWKMYYICAELEAGAKCIENARRMFRKAIEFCPVPLRWKIWLAGARREVMVGKEEVAMKLIRRAEQVVPQKYRYIVLLEYSKMEEYCGRVENARKWTQIAKAESPHEWKVFLESVLLEMRNGEYDRARKEANEGLALHGGTGRLWAMHIRLQYHLGEEQQFQLFQKALKLVPKSGEVWCEGARIRLNPLSSLFSVEMAKKYLSFAIKFTPQYGDNFIEYLRAELLTVGPRIDEEEEIKHLERLCVNAEPNYGPLWFFCRKSPIESSIKVIRRAKSLLITELVKYQSLYQEAILCQNMQYEKKIKAIKKLKEDHSYMDFMTGLRNFVQRGMDPKTLNAHQKNVLEQSIFSDTFNI